MVDGDRAYVSNWSGGNSITIIDTGSDNVIGSISLAPEPGRAILDNSDYGCFAAEAT
ncbi:MAG: hypothetical protein R2744_00670 [Bacteroidales bacterium]